MSRRNWAPGKSMRSTAAYACSRASATDPPSPVTFRTRPPALTRRPSRTAVPAWKTSAPPASASSMPPICDPGSGASGYPAGGEHDAHGRLGPGRELHSAERSPGRAREGAEEVALEPREDRLSLGVAEAAIELEHARPVAGQHEACVEQPDERRAAGRELGQDRAVHEFRRARRSRPDGGTASASSSPFRPCSVPRRRREAA